MRLTDAIKEKGGPYWIPDCTRSELPEFFKSLGFKVGVEVGVSWGRNLENYCKAGFTMSGVDPFVDHSKTNKKMETVYRLARRRLLQYPNCTLIRKDSMEALNGFPKRSLDFVYIDGNHDFGHVAMDLMRWTDKVRKGGIVAGHDYYSTAGNRDIRQVGYVVDSFTKSYDIANWYVLGRKNEDRKPDEKFDNELSYMFFKHW